jgi:hypothetical protein
LAVAGIQVGRVEIKAFDLQPDIWEPAARESLEVAHALAPGIIFDLHYERVDLRSDSVAANSPFHLITFQNCINEICRDHTPSWGMIAALGLIQHGGSLMIADFNRYPATCDTLRDLEGILQRRGWEALATFDVSHEEECLFYRAPAETYRHFYDLYRTEGGWSTPRLQRRRHLRFSWSTWRRKND